MLSGPSLTLVWVIVVPSEARKAIKAEGTWEGEEVSFSRMCLHAPVAERHSLQYKGQNQGCQQIQPSLFKRYREDATSNRACAWGHNVVDLISTPLFLKPNDAPQKTTS